MIKDVKQKNENVNGIDEKILKLKEIFPNCFDINGNFDISNFENDISGNINVTKEGYGLNFLGKNYAKYVASLDTETILVPDEENNKKDENKDSENIYISGDNIDALKHLVKSYTGRIKCIYIDPPYNTGSDGFIYNDKFNLSVDKLVDALDINEEEAKRIFDMTNSTSNSHSAWLTFMYPRLYLAKQLLSEDGVIFISIDDNEQSQLKLLCDNVFGESNIIGQLIHQRAKGGGQAKYIVKGHDYILVYAKQLNPELSLKRKKIIQQKTYEIDGKIYLKDDDVIRKVFGKYDKNLNDRRCFYEELIQYKGEEKKKEVDDKIALGEYFLEENAFGMHTICRYVPLEDAFSKLYSIITVMSEEGKNELESIELPYFDYPKPTRLLKELINAVTFDTDNEIVLDFFSGSASTADAVMQINAEDNKHLKYIMIQIPEKTSANSKAYEEGFKTIDEIGQERIRRAAKKIKQASKVDIDYGFKHYIVKKLDLNTLDKLEKFEPNWIAQDKSIVDEFGINSVLTTWMNIDGYGLSDFYDKLQLDNYEAYRCDNSIYLINPNLSDKAIKCLIEKYENDESFDCNRIVLFGYSFDLCEIQTLKDNLKQVKNIKNINVDLITRY